MNIATRTSIFISHATPDDNDFAVWLASRLSMAGYGVWVDAQALLGGEDFWRVIETAIRNDCLKFVVALSPIAVKRPGVMDEIALARTVGRSLKDDNFIIPLRIGGLPSSDIPVDLHRLNAIDFDKGWGAGFERLLEVFAREAVPRASEPVADAVDAWRQFHLLRAQAISDRPEVLTSNHLPIAQFPEQLNFFEFGCPVEASDIPKMVSRLKVPAFQHHRLVGSFAEWDEIQEAFGPSIPIKVRAQVSTAEFLSGRLRDPGVLRSTARNQMVSLLRKAWDQAMESKGLRRREMADGSNAWWFPAELVDGDKLSVRKEGRRASSRQVIGTRTKKSGPVHWHLGFSAKPKMGERPHFILKPRVTITEDQQTPVADAKKMNRLRKFVCSSWFNPVWRDQTLGFIQWLADGKENYSLPLAANAFCLTANAPMAFLSPVTMAPGEAWSEEEEAREIAEKLDDPAFLPPDDDFDEDDD